jgi:uncharacterized FAD-dependent dehydrogenase
MAIRLFEIKLPIEHGEEDLPKAILSALNLPARELQSFRVRREAIDARKKSAIHFSYTIDAVVSNEAKVLASKHACKVSPTPDEGYATIAPGTEKLAHRPVVVGTGPAGLFAGLTLARAGYKPILLERGRSVDERVGDVERFWKDGHFDPESNAQFGEGGAGTFSDGKLTTLINDPRCAAILGEFVAAGAPESILVAGRPHVGTDTLRRVLKAMRQTITGLGGEFHFSSRLSGIRVRDGRLAAAEVEGRGDISCEVAVLAIGHSADDTIAKLFDAGLSMKPKAFAIGLRIEHPQALIDAAQYGRWAGHPRVGPAEYKLAWHAEGGRSAFTFCMCPGGEVVAAASREGCLVTNGMSYAARDGKNANAGILVNVTPLDFPDAHPLAGFAFQRHWEAAAFALGGGDYRAPVQTLGDFLRDQASSKLGAIHPTYTPGVTLANLRNALPAFVGETIAAALPQFGKRIHGFDRGDALLTGVETRSSSPVRIERDEDFQCSVAGLYPAGEGAGYAGGIMSAAADGMRVAEGIIARFAQP